MSRIVTPDGLIPGENGKPDRPPTLQERLDTALDHWKFKRRDEAFATALNAIAYLSNGLADLAKLTGRLERHNAELSQINAELAKKVATLIDLMNEDENSNANGGS